MANWIGVARSNYFHVADRDAFDDMIAPIRNAGLEVVSKGGDPTWIALIADDENGWPSEYEPEDENDPQADAFGMVQFDIAEIVAPFLVDGEVAIFMETGFEKAKYVTGVTVAINNKGERRRVDLYDIYDLAREIGSYLTKAEY